MLIQQTHEEWVEGVKRLLLERESQPILLIIHNEFGLELLSNFNDMALMLGVIRAAQIRFETTFKVEIEKKAAVGQSDGVVASVQRIISGKKTEVN
jgi:hypothetical protein